MSHFQIYQRTRLKLATCSPALRAIDAILARAICEIAFNQVDARQAVTDALRRCTPYMSQLEPGDDELFDGICTGWPSFCTALLLLCSCISIGTPVRHRPSFHLNSANQGQDLNDAYNHALNANTGPSAPMTRVSQVLST